MAWHGFLAKAVPTRGHWRGGVAACEAPRSGVKAPLRAATVSVAAQYTLARSRAQARCHARCFEQRFTDVRRR